MSSEDFSSAHIIGVAVKHKQKRALKWSKGQMDLQTTGLNLQLVDMV